MSSSENRKFYRADFKTHGYILFEDGEQLPFELKNISLKGILVLVSDSRLKKGDAYKLRIKLMSSDIEIDTTSVLVHEEDGEKGFFFREIDLDSMIHLRRLLELNTPNEGEIEKELSFLKDYS
ncbi:MAG: PilZ domain-containing protein [Spirochaetales bacterium]|nr:PilZ domain-containing protein [Spirochaetales bacterium]